MDANWCSGNVVWCVSIGYDLSAKKAKLASSCMNIICSFLVTSSFSFAFLLTSYRRKMPECNFFVRNGYCSNGEECLYLHVDPDSKIPLCPHYENGFCPLGPTCSKKHVRKPICKFYLAGFCPDGRQGCKEGAHPRWTTGLAPPTVKKPREEREDGGDMVRDGGRDGGRGDGGDRGDRGFGGRGGFEGRRRFYGGRGRRDRDR